MLRAWLRPAGTLEQHHAAAAKQVKQRIAENGIPAPQERRAVGRPRIHPLAVAGSKHPRDDDCDDTAAAEQPQKRKYHHWISSDLFPHIVKAYNDNGHSARAAVRFLQHSRTLNISGVFDALNPSTVHQWFDTTTHRLTERVQQLRSNGERYSRIGVAGRPRVLDEFPAVEEAIKTQLRALRAGGAAMHFTTVKCVMSYVLSQHELGQRLMLSRRWLRNWIDTVMDWSWGAATTAANKVPSGWRDHGTVLAKRVAVDMEQHKIHESLVINADQMGLQLCPGARCTYEKRGSKRVAVAGHDDKRQITCVVSSALSGELLPLQLVFTGKTDASHPPAPANHLATQQGMHLTHTHNHWSNLDSTKDWIRHIVEPWRLRKVVEHKLAADAHVLLILDVWHVHISPTFRSWLEQQFPHYHLRFVPPNCTSELQVADVALNHPLKHAVKKRFNEYVAHTVEAAMRQPTEAEQCAQLKQMLLMSELKPRLLLWVAEAWQLLSQENILIFKGWKRCVLDLYDVRDATLREKAYKEAKEQQVDSDNGVPADAEGAAEHKDVEEASDEEIDSSDDEKPTRQVMKERIFGERRSSRQRNEPARLGLLLRTDQLQIVPE
jgi:hypothetical protein